MKKREKILAAVTGVLLVVFAATFLFSGGSGQTLGQLRSSRDQLAKEVEEKKADNVVILHYENDDGKVQEYKKLFKEKDFFRGIFVNFSNYSFNNISSRLSGINFLSSTHKCLRIF